MAPAAIGALLGQDEPLKLRALFQVAAALGSALALEDVAAVVVEQLLPLAGATAGALVVPAFCGDAVVTVGAAGYGDAGWIPPDLSRSTAHPLADAVRTGVSVVLGSAAEWRTGYPELAAAYHATGCEALLVVPCTAGATPLGAIAFGFPPDHALTEDDVAFAEALAQQCTRTLERARAYEQAVRARDQLRAVITAASVGMLVVEGASGRLAIANPRAAEILGLPADALRDATVLPAPIPPSIVERAFAGETVTGEELLLVRPDGERRTLLLNASRARTDEVEGEAVVVVLEDVTERRRRESQHRAAATRLRRLMDSNVMGVVTADEERILDTNDLFLSMIGREREEVRAGTVRWSDLTPSEFASADEAAFRHLRAHGSWRPYEKELIRRDGSRLPVLVGAALLEPEPLQWICFAFDLTERRHEERRQQVLAATNRALAEYLELDHTLDALAHLAVGHLADLCIVDVVERMRSPRRVRAAHRDADLAGKLASLAGEPPVPVLDSAVATVLETGRSLTVDDIAPERFLVSLYGEGRQPSIELGVRSFVVVPLLAGGHSIGCLILAANRPGAFESSEMIVARDLATRAALAIDHAHLYEEARRAAREREEMVAIVTHDLRSPLNAISMASSTLLAPGLAPHRKVMQAALIRESVERMAHLIQDLLDVTRLGAGQLPIAPAPENVQRLLDAASASALPAAEARHVRLEVRPPRPRNAMVLADRGRVLQILGNLLDNAVRYTPEGGAVTVTAARDGPMMSFSVSDTGRGITADELPHVFDRFWQAHRHDREGAGLGLAIARGLVEKHGGTIAIASTPGQGTTVSFTLPMPPAPPEPDAQIP